MAKVEDYLPGGEKDPNKAAGGLDGEINDAANQQKARERDPVTGQFVSTPEEVDWEQRYKELERLNSRQAQDLGTYRRLVDDYITNPTPAATAVEQESQPITVDDLYDNPNESIDKRVDSHPAIAEVRELKALIEQQRREAQLREFTERHPDYQTIGSDPAFINWVEGDPMRAELYSRGNQFDLSAADALFRLYKAENQVEQVTTEQTQAQQIAAANLEESSNVMVQEPPKYSRSEYVDTLMRARQGDLEAERWVQRNAAGYREALANENVRD